MGRKKSWWIMDRDNWRIGWKKSRYLWEKTCVFFSLQYNYRAYFNLIFSPIPIVQHSRQKWSSFFFSSIKPRLFPILHKKSRGCRQLSGLFWTLSLHYLDIHCHILLYFTSLSPRYSLVREAYLCKFYQNIFLFQ